MNIFFFSSNSLTNIWAGIGAGLWAVPMAEGSHRKGLITKSKRLKVGSLGMFYCSETHSLTTPFIVNSTPDTDAVVSDVWKGEWMLPFKVHALGSPRKQYHKDKAKEELAIFYGKRNESFTSTLRVAPQMIFLSTEITDDDWSIMMSRLI